MIVGDRVHWLARLLANFISACQDARDTLIVAVSFPLTTSKVRHTGLLVAAVLISLSTTHSAWAQDSAGFYEIETKYIFGFTEGTSIGLEGEKEVSAESVAGIGKRDGRYFATQTKLEFEHTP